jgi:hypothetical protein
VSPGIADDGFVSADGSVFFELGAEAGTPVAEEAADFLDFSFKDFSKLEAFNRAKLAEFGQIAASPSLSTVSGPNYLATPPLSRSSTPASTPCLSASSRTHSRQPSGDSELGLLTPANTSSPHIMPPTSLGSVRRSPIPRSPSSASTAHSGFGAGLVCWSRTQPVAWLGLLLSSCPRWRHTSAYQALS